MARVIREAQLPDQFMVDYVRVYQEDPAARPHPVVRLERKGQGTVVPLGGAAEFAASAVAPGDRIERLCLFSNGRLRAEFDFSSGLTTGSAYWHGARDLPPNTAPGPAILSAYRLQSQ